ncbi:hypothetical protein OE749_18050 [Aestuariibacter sp. AA17]|uniref:Uncharacterized protein n=1 Tax=Fluctibacter corallii TaxID=2984329 RepID=A0ABT3AD50_9ALTE|nr:hypothetical protein [Aestuariibacter sp. AA17]MCV2886601.1 hypothetical protein [Aestuariibacter sp. AA17]
MQIKVLLGALIGLIVGYFIGVTSQQERLIDKDETPTQTPYNVSDVQRDEPQPVLSEIPASPAAPSTQWQQSAVPEENPLDATQADITSTGMHLNEGLREKLAEKALYSFSFPDEETDWQAQTYISDFFELHEYGPQVELYNLSCSVQVCVMNGQYHGNKDEWEGIVYDLRNQDWWQYAHTSHRASSKDDGPTYFQILVSHAEN